MAVSNSSRLGLVLWSAESDPYNRTQAMQTAQALDQLVAIDVSGLAAARPAPGIRGRYFHATDTNDLLRDTGTAWVLLNGQRALGSAAQIVQLQAGTAAAAGSTGAVADAGHVHAVPVAQPATLQAGSATAAGSSGSLSRADHVHALTASTAAGASAPGDAGRVGSSGDVARADHQHGREAWGAVGDVAAVTPGSAAAAGSAGKASDAGHVHALAAAVAGGSAPGDVAAGGSASSVSRSDHVHGREPATEFFTVPVALGGWQPVGTGVRLWKTSDGVCHMVGAVTNNSPYTPDGSTTNTPLGVLPVKYRPVQRVFFVGPINDNSGLSAHTFQYDVREDGTIPVLRWSGAGAVPSPFWHGFHASWPTT